MVHKVHQFQNKDYIKPGMSTSTRLVNYRTVEQIFNLSSGTQIISKMWMFSKDDGEAYVNISFHCSPCALCRIIWEIFICTLDCIEKDFNVTCPFGSIQMVVNIYSPILRGSLPMSYNPLNCKKG